MKSPMLFLHEVLKELGTWCHVSTTIDIKTINGRFEHEGMSFLTISLPTFGKDLEKGLDQGFVDRNLFQGFSWKGGLPRLFGGFLDLVFDRGTGRLVDIPDITAIYSLRQLTLLFSKLEGTCTPARVSAAIEGYIDCERDIRTNDHTMLGREDYLQAYARIGRLLYSGIYSVVDKHVYDGTIIPRVSSGATADRLRGNSKYGTRVWHERLDKYFPIGEFLVPRWGFLLSDGGIPDFDIREPGMEQPVRVITVPKTMKTPRIIAIEPFCMQYVQQGILEQFTKVIDEDNLLSKLISWKSQIPNQQLAKEGSIHGSLATLDLSEASDRVSNQLVRLLLKNHPHLSGAVDSCRSRKADVPGHGVKRLAKFASMGSALCFPFEAMVFCTLVFLGIEQKLNRQLSRKDIKSFLGKVRIYGDDIIVPVEFVESVTRTLTDFGLKVNANKSFWTGKFRESCGKDFYDGHDVSVVKVREEFPTSRRHVSEIQSIVSLRNQLFKRGFTDTLAFLDNIIEGLIPFPYVSEESPALGRLRHEGFETQRWDPNLQRPLVKAAVVSSRLPISRLEGGGALLKFFLKRGDLPLSKDHLKRAGRPDSSDIKIRWVTSQ